jgi:hypothetical protein
VFNATVAVDTGFQEAAAGFDPPEEEDEKYWDDLRDRLRKYGNKTTEGCQRLVVPTDHSQGQSESEDSNNEESESDYDNEDTEESDDYLVEFDDKDCHENSFEDRQDNDSLRNELKEVGKPKGVKAKKTKALLRKQERFLHSTGFDVRGRDVTVKTKSQKKKEALLNWENLLDDIDTSGRAGVESKTVSACVRHLVQAWYAQGHHKDVSESTMFHALLKHCGCSNKRRHRWG